MPNFDNFAGVCRAESPCKDCKDRTVGCHSSCQNYIQFQSRLADEKEKLEKSKNRDFEAYRHARKSKYYHKKGLNNKTLSKSQLKRNK